MTYSPLLLQLAVILATARLLGLVLRLFGQPAVIGEMAAGIVLGPVILGALAPDLQASVFPKGSLAALDGLSQLGLVLFMFVVGAEVRLPTDARRQLKDAAWVGVMGVVFPAALGLLLGSYLYADFAPAGVARLPFALFVAAALSITAFPIMARILKERRMTQTRIGRLALTSAAVTDLLAWIVLAFVVAIASAHEDWARLGRVLGGIAALIAVVMGVVRPLLASLLRRHAHDGRPDGTVLATLLIGTFACAFVTKLLGVHPVFGSFLFGLALPRDDRLLDALIERIEHVAVIVLMPVFFALAGLSTTHEAFVGAGLATLLLVIAAAVAGKIVGAVLGARCAGRPLREALAVGSLMNARGLMELIVIRVGLDVGLIREDLFTMLLVMALVTTFMTGPLLTLFTRGQSLAPEAERSGAR